MPSTTLNLPQAETDTGFPLLVVPSTPSKPAAARTPIAGAPAADSSDYF
jgi:hypothetical protein